MSSAVLIALLIAFTGQYVWLGLLVGIILSFLVVGKDQRNNN
jgi:hypothetical protein